MSRLDVWLAWPAFLACSWTWCIGMYLPVLLRDIYGWPAVLVFAIPNVIGVMHFAWSIRSTPESRAFEARHASWLTAFSVVTVAYHAFFFAWIWRWEYGAGWLASLAVAPALYLVALVTAALSDQALKRLGVLVFGVSVALLALYSWTVFDETTRLALGRDATWTREDPIGALFLAPIVTLGFLFGPYFDLTFHRAYRHVGGGVNGRNSFFMFGVLFAIMIGFTALYAVYGFTRLVTVHLLVQGWFTMTLHIREISRSTSPRHDRSKGRLIALTLVAALLGPLPLVLADYRYWYLFYGIVIPTVGLCMAVRRRFNRRPMSPLLVGLLIVLFTPFGFFGFVGGQEWLLVIPVAAMIVLGCAGAPVGRPSLDSSSPDNPFERAEPVEQTTETVSA
ncbi:MAG: hypothetical protein ACF8PN_03070 [Phycisphaerales bacterium]